MKILEVVEPNEAIYIGKSNSYGVCKFKGGMAHTFGTHEFAILHADFTLQSLLN